MLCDPETQSYTPVDYCCAKTSWMSILCFYQLLHVVSFCVKNECFFSQNSTAFSANPITKPSVFMFQMFLKWWGSVYIWKKNPITFQWQFPVVFLVMCCDSAISCRPLFYYSLTLHFLPCLGMLWVLESPDAFSNAACSLHMLELDLKTCMRENANSSVDCLTEIWGVNQCNGLLLPWSEPQC